MSLRLQGTPENEPGEPTHSVNNRLLIISVAVLFVFAAMQVTQAQKKGPTELKITTGDIQSLNGKLQGFERQLSQQEMGAMGLVLWRAATAPLDDPSGINIRASFFDLGSPTEAVRPAQKRKIGGAGPQAPAADAEVVKILYAALGGSQGANPPAPGTINTLADKLQGFGKQLSVQERGIMNWLLQRAGSNQIRESPRQTGPAPGTPGGPAPTLGQALGAAAFGSRPGANSSMGWDLRF